MICDSCGKPLIGDEKCKDNALCDRCYQKVNDASHAEESFRQNKAFTKTGIMGTLLGVAIISWLIVFIVDRLVGGAILAVGAPLLIGYCFSLAIVSTFECWKGKITKPTATIWLVVAGVAYLILYDFHIDFR